MAATFVASYGPGAVVGASASQTTSTASVTCAAGDVLLVGVATANQLIVPSSVSGGGLTWTELVEANPSGATASNSCMAWFGATSSSAQTFTATVTVSDSASSTHAWTWGCQRWSGAAVGSTFSALGSTTGQTTFTTTAANAALALGIADWNAVTGARTYVTATAGAAAETMYVYSAGVVAGYLAYYANDGAAGSKTVGTSAPTGVKDAIAVVELLTAASAAGSITLGGSATASSSVAAAGSVTLGGSATAVAVTPTPTPAPVTLPPLVSTGTRWNWAMGPWSGLPTLEMANATKRSMKLRLAGSSEATWVLEGSTPEASAMQELITDVWCIRNGFTLFRGRLGGTSHTADGTSYNISYTAGDYRALLQRRLLFDSDTLTYTSTEQASIAWGLVSSTQGQAGGGLNLTNATTATGTTRTITYPAGQSIGQAIEQLSLMDSGFNWDIVPSTGVVGQAFTTWSSRGKAAEVVVDYPGRIAKFTRTVDPGAYANAVRETGNTGVAAVRQESSDIATRAEGRWDVQMGDTSLLDATSVTSRAAYDLAARQAITPAYTVTLQPGSWGGPPDIWLGDSVLLVINAGPVQTAVNLRVYEIDIDLDEADTETVTLTLSALDPFKRARARQVEFRLTQLERR